MVLPSQSGGLNDWVLVTGIRLSQAESKSVSEPTRLVEHFFRHEYGNLVSTLTRIFGVARLDLVEDMVNSAMLHAMESWKQGGVPENPAGWIHRVAKNRILDSLRREKTHEKALAFAEAFSQSNSEQHSQLLDQLFDEDTLHDSLLRMMFVCCHPCLDRKSQIALTLKILCGFSIREIARGLLLTEDATKKRIQRGKAKLAEEQISVELPAAEELDPRRSAVHDVLYLLFNEGYSTTQGHEPIRDDVCEEAARLCHLLCEHQTLSDSETRALLSLMLFHAARLDARTDSLGNAVLLEDQDRSQWDRGLIDVAQKWLIRSASPEASRFHFEALIAQLHCTAASIEETDWKKIVALYDRLLDRYSSPVYRLNRAIAICQTGDSHRALEELALLREEPQLQEYYLLDCAAGYLHEKAGDLQAATDSWLAALSSDIPPHQKILIKRRLEQLTS